MVHNTENAKYPRLSLAGAELKNNGETGIPCSDTTVLLM